MLQKLGDGLRYTVGLSSLRCRLLVLVAFALLPLWAIVGNSLFDRRNQAVASALQQSQTVVRLALQEQQRLIDQAEQLLAVLARVPAVRTADPASCSQIMRDIVELHPPFTGMGRASAQGEVVCNSLPLAGPVSIADRDYFQNAIQTRTFAVSQYLLGRVSGRATLAVGYPVLHETTRAPDGIAYVAIDLGWLGQLLAASELPPQTVVSIIDRNGTLLARHPADAIPIGQPLPVPELVRTILDTREGTAQLNSEYGDLRLYAFAPLGNAEDGRGYITVGIPMEVLVGPAQRQLGRGAFGLGLFTLFIVGIAWAGSELLVLRQLRQLIDATRRLARGDLSARTGFRVGKGEINELAHSFDGMAASLQQREAELQQMNADLEQRVEQRTAELVTINRELAAREQDLRDAQERLEQTVASSRVLLYSVELPSHRVSYISANARRVTGYDAGEIAADPAFWRKVTLSEDHEAFGARFAAATAAMKTSYEFEFQFRHRDGALRWLAGTSEMEYGPDALPVSYLWSLFDITERKQAEDEVRQATIFADKANQAKSEFLSRMSHELRTPMNAILGFAQLLELDELTEEQEESVAQILKGGRHLLDLINEVLDISRIEAGRLNLSPEPVQASDVLAEAVDLLRPLAVERQIALHADLSGPARRHVLADRQRLKQVILNLLSNAVKYNRVGGSVTVTCTEAPGSRLHITVADTGIGIPAARLGQVFSPFERLGAELTEVQGTGLGLALSRRLLEAMDGTINVTSEAGVGSVFTVELPLVIGQEERLDSMLDALDHAVSNGNIQHAKVLYIEDNLSNLRLIERLLSRWPEVTLLTAMQGQLGLDLAREHQPDIVLLDLHLPDLLGDHVLVQLLADPRTQDGAVVMVSADATPGQVTRLLATGAKAYLTKPIDVKQFYDVLEQLLKERRG